MRSAEKPLLVPYIIAAALFMEQLDSTIIGTALPTIAEALHASPLHLSGAITAYLLSLSVFIPLSGWMADRYGARRVFMAAIVIFTLGSALCGQAGSLVELIAARAVQGIGGAMMSPVGRIVLIRSTPRSGLVRAMAFVTLPALMGPVLGPPLGGFIATYASWRWIFYLNLPIGLAGLALAYAFVPDDRTEDPPPFDLMGWILSGLGLALVVLSVETVGRGLMPPAATAAIAALGLGLLLLYVRHAGRVTRPILPVDLFRIPSYRVAILGGAVYRVGIGAIPLLLPLMLQLGFGLSPLDSGLLTLASAVGALSMKATAPSILRRFGFRPVLVGNAVLSGLLIMAYGLLRPDTPPAAIFVLLLVSGFFRSLQFTSVNTLAFADIPDRRVSQASSLSSTAQQLFLTLGVGLGAALVQLVMIGRGGSVPEAQDFAIAFAAIGLVALSSVLVFRTLPPGAGDAVSGYRSPAPLQPDASD
ncbi:DHA2 family efflux MFS transporter permease subunit [Arenibaculum pallidiluteum]|uniref:DHA2 family efflux MFS transporter permease subunit n=1 Tax=Arenibaculum pallidiluteum TaxID=2812559 RepID=UPI001F34B66C|nr:DHA2 family efflux MFS transporter permease subunit [Arenibaculum pallidiluteum]